MPNTRTSARRLVSKRRLSRREVNVTSDDDNSIRRACEDTEAEIGMSVEDHLREVSSGVERLHTRIRSLKHENENLRSELQQVERTVNSGAGSRFGSGEKASRQKVLSLERTIVHLRAALEKERRTIEKLRDTEVERDAKELADDHGEVVPTQQTVDLGESAIKLLRRMCDTINMNTLAEGEECAICMEEMAVEKCYSLPCQHPVCVECFGRLGDGSNMVPNHQTVSVQCPHCREIYPREECEIITHTAVQQWDLLLDISRQWAAMGIGEIDIGEDDDDEDSFVDDGSVTATERSVKPQEEILLLIASSPRLPEILEEAADLDLETSAASASPNDTGPIAYKSLPSPLKRKRLTELVAQRAVKQRV